MTTIVTTAKKFGPLFKRREMMRIGKLDDGIVQAAQRGAQRFLRRQLPKYEGTLRRSTYVRIYTRGVRGRRSSVICEIIEDTPYAKAIEFGTRPYSPPIYPLFVWAMVKLNLDESHARSVAYAIRARVQVEGFEANYYTRDAMPKLIGLLEPHLRAAFEASRSMR